MIYGIIYILLFLKPSINKKDIGSQIARGVIGAIFSFMFFYLANADRTFSFIFAVIWIPALVQIVFAGIESGKDKNNRANNVTAALAGVIFLLCIGYNFFPYITGGAKKLASMVPVKESSEMISKVDAEHIIVISPETAYYEMQKMLGTLPNPSVYKIGELGITMTKDEAVYVAPIEVDGVLKAISNGEIPGVIYVSAEKPSQASIINVPSKTAESLVFGRDLERYIRKHKAGAILFQANAELDNEGNPYYVGSYGHYKYGRKGAVIDGVILVSFKDGSIVDYKKDKVPDWVDEVHPSDIAEAYNGYFGTLGNGLWNKLIAKKGVHIPTQWQSETKVQGLDINSSEVTGVIDASGRMKWFTDHTNTSNTSTTMTGYSLMDMKTGEMIYYKTPGYINGKGAMNAVGKALGANVANWTPVQPLFYNIFGAEAWVVPVVNVTDGALVKVAIVSAKNSYVVLEDSKDMAIESFKNAIAYGKINDLSNRNANSIKADEKTIIGKVARINPVTENGNTIFYIKLEGQNTIFMVNKSAGVDIVLTRDGDTVEIKYLDIKDNNVVSTVSFKNNSVK